MEEVPKTSSGNIDRATLLQFAENMNAKEYQRVFDLASSNPEDKLTNMPKKYDGEETAAYSVSSFERPCRANRYAPDVLGNRR